MDNNASHAAAAINAVAAAISSTDPRHTSRGQSRWKNFWNGLWCFRSQKRDKRIVPASRLDTSSTSARGWPQNGPAQAGLALAPPSSPASFVNSSLQSPNLSLSTVSANVCSPPPNPMFTIGPYAHETQLVSPPVFSTFTTEPSTAPFTPPPELAHLTTPSSPDVPFAQLLASSLEAKASARDNVSPFSGSSLASPADIPTGELQATYQLYPGSPVSHLVSPTSGIYGSGTSSPIPAIEFPAQLNGLRGSPIPFFPQFALAASLANDQSPCTMLTLPPSLEPESQHSLTFFGPIGQSDYIEHHSNPRRDADGKIEVCANMPAVATDNSNTFSNGASKTDKEVGSRNGEERGNFTKGERALNGFFLKENTGTIWQNFDIDYKKESYGRSLESRYMCNNLFEAAFVKNEHKATKEWAQQLKNPLECEDLDRRKIADSEDVEIVSHLPEGAQDALTTECSSQKTKGRAGSGLCPVLQDKHCCIKELDSPGYGPKYSIDNQANTCTCGGLTTKRSEPSATLEHAKERLLDYEVSNNAIENSNKEEDNYS